MASLAEMAAVRAALQLVIDDCGRVRVSAGRCTPVAEGDPSIAGQVEQQGSEEARPRTTSDTQPFIPRRSGCPAGSVAAAEEAGGRQALRCSASTASYLALYSVPSPWLP